MLAVLNLVVGALGAIACLLYSGLAVLTFIMSSPPGTDDPLPYYIVVLVLGLTALMTAALAGCLVVGIGKLRHQAWAMRVGLVLAFVVGFLAVIICLALALSPFTLDRDSLARLVGPPVVVSGLYCGLTLAVWLRELVRSTSQMSRRNCYTLVTPARLGTR